MWYEDDEFATFKYFPAIRVDGSSKILELLRGGEPQVYALDCRLIQGYIVYAVLQLS